VKNSRFTDSRIVPPLQEVGVGASVAQLLRKHGISTTTHCTWRSRHAGISVSDLEPGAIFRR